MENVTQLNSYSWKTCEFPICSLLIRAHALAQTLGMKMDIWQEDGLGDATGFMCQSNAGLAIYVVDHVYGTTHFCDSGPVIYVEAGEVVEKGITNVLDSVLAALSLTIDKVDWKQSVDARESAQELAIAAMNYRARR